MNDEVTWQRGWGKMKRSATSSFEKDDGSNQGTHVDCGLLKTIKKKHWFKKIMEKRGERKKGKSIELTSIFGSFMTLEKEVDQTYDFLPDMSDLDPY